MFGAVARELPHVQVADTSLTEIEPTERTADLVLLFSRSPGRAPRHALVVEVQLAVDREKKRSWWWYLVGVHTRHRCDASLVVVAPTRAVAAWAARPIGLGHPGVLLRPIVIGPDAVPVVETEEEAARAPETVVLSAMVYGGTKAGEAIGRAALAAVANLDEERAALHTDVVLAAMPIAMRATLEKLMASGTYQYRSEFAKRYVAQGEATGEARGEARGRALAVLAVLAARSVEVAPGLRERVLACDDVSTLDVWLARAANAKTAGEVNVGDTVQLFVTVVLSDSTVSDETTHVTSWASVPNDVAVVLAMGVASGSATGTNITVTPTFTLNSVATAATAANSCTITVD